MADEMYPYNEDSKKFNRRDFLYALGLMAISGKFAVDTFSNLSDEQTRKKIYELGKYVHLADYSVLDKNGNENKSKGAGICLDDFFFTVDHIPSAIEKQRYLMPPGIIVEQNIDVEEKNAKLGSLEMKELVRNSDKDIAIYWIGKDRYEKEGFKEFPCNPTSQRNLGDVAYIIGNPRLTGTNIRETTVSDLDGFGNLTKTEGGFGIADGLIPGDSGTPLVNENYELLGLNNITINNCLGYAVKIEEFLKELKNGQQIRKKIKQD